MEVSRRLDLRPPGRRAALINMSLLLFKLPAKLFYVGSRDAFDRGCDDSGLDQAT